MSSHTGLRELFLLRHAKSDYRQANVSDFDRPLSKRGREDALKMGQWMQANALIPDLILASASQRTIQTLKRVKLSIDKAHQIPCTPTPELYLADMISLLTQLSQITPNDGQKVLIVGHNPGLEQLLNYLTNQLCVSANSCVTLFPTCSLAHLVLPADWSQLAAGCGKQLNLWQVKQLPH